MLLAIDPFTEANGATEVFPRVHQQGYLSAKDGAHHYVELRDLPTEPVPLILEPGDVAIFGCFTPHRSGPNQSTLLAARLLSQLQRPLRWRRPVRQALSRVPRMAPSRAPAEQHAVTLLSSLAVSRKASVGTKREAAESSSASWQWLPINQTHLRRLHLIGFTYGWGAILVGCDRAWRRPIPAARMALGMVTEPLLKDFAARRRGWPGLLFVAQLLGTLIGRVFLSTCRLDVRPLRPPLDSRGQPAFSRRGGAMDEHDRP